MKKICTKIAALLLTLCLSVAFASCSLLDILGEDSSSSMEESSVSSSIISSEDSSEEVSSEEVSSEEESSIEESSEDSSSEEESSVEESSEEVSSEEESSEEVSSEEESSAEDSSEEVSSEEESSVEESSEEISSEEESSVEESSEEDSSNIELDAFQIHFLELGIKNNGDCTLIKTGNTEILIDAGSRMSSATTINNYLAQYCTDGVLEYVIATHAHQDHIAAFVGETVNGKKTGVLYNYKVDTLIQFSKTGVTSQIYNNYKTAVSYAKSKGTKVYTALECWNNTNGAKRSYTLGENGTISMNILYNYYYDHSASEENDYSVCMMLSQGDNHYLFTGDLESQGEKYLVQYNDLPKVQLFKAGHHGSKTSSTSELMSVIQPKIVCVCCCCWYNEYNANKENIFPSQSFINNVAPYTDKVYITSMVANNSQGFQSMNGNIVVSTTNGVVSVNCSNNNTILKDTAWFKQNRTTPSAWR